MNEPLIRLDGVSRVYGSGATEVRALDDVDLAIPAGQFVSLLGPSGSGKTTLLNVVGAIDHPTHGSILVDGVELVGLDRGELTAYRRDKVGFVFQFFNLVPTLTALENVELIASLTDRGDAHQRSLDALASVGLAELLDRFPAQLSGGQQQRVAIARAIAKETPVLLCDEPTGALDRATGEEVLGLLRGAVSDLGRTVIVVSHDPTVEHVSDRSLHLVDGRLVDDRLRGDGPDVAGARGGGDAEGDREGADDGAVRDEWDERAAHDGRAVDDERAGRPGDVPEADGGRGDGTTAPAAGASVDAGTGGP